MVLVGLVVILKVLVCHIASFLYGLFLFVFYMENMSYVVIAFFLRSLRKCLVLRCYT